jgi:hypothetical protein
MSSFQIESEQTFKTHKNRTTHESPVGKISSLPLNLKRDPGNTTAAQKKWHKMALVFSLHL